MSNPWKTVQSDGMPPCDGETYVGINSAGYACCFNEIRHGVCLMESAEDSVALMGDLRDWRVLDRPSRIQPEQSNV